MSTLLFASETVHAASPAFPILIAPWSSPR